MGYWKMSSLCSIRGCIELIKMWNYWIEKFRECVDFVCLNNTVHECYEICDKKEFPDDVNECYAICNELYEENARFL